MNLSQNINVLIRRAIEPLTQKVRLMISRGVISMVNDALKCQGVQIQLLADEVREDVERFQEYGYTSVPFKDAEAIYLSVGGNRTHGIVIATEDRRYRPKSLVEGDVCLYTDKGERVYINRVSDIVNIGAKSAADFVALAGKVATELTNIKNAYDVHTHPTGMGPSGPPAIPLTAPASTAASKVKAT
jgi:phage baseplate assembly protein V